MERSFVPLDDFFYLIVIEVFHIKILVQVKYTNSLSDAHEGKRIYSEEQRQKCLMSFFE